MGEDISAMPQDNQWQQIWDARMMGLSQILGQPGDSVYHAIIPFEFRGQGGTADVVPFPNYISGMTYVTSELTGGNTPQLPNSLGNYELVICLPHELTKAADLIAKLACYTCDSIIEPGHTMDLGGFFGDSAIQALLFATLGEEKTHFSFNGQTYGLLLCLGITNEELDFAQNFGAELLVDFLRKKAVFPYTMPDRKPFKQRKSFFSRLFGR